MNKTIPNTSNLQAPPLWQQLLGVHIILSQMQNGKPMSSSIEMVSVHLRPGVQALSYAVLRHYASAQLALRLLANRNPPKELANFLLISLALLCQDSKNRLANKAELQFYQTHTLVDQTIEALKKKAGPQAQTGFLNACLRSFLREESAIMHQINQDDSCVWNCPTWWIDRLQNDHPEQWQSILEQNQIKAPLTLRVNLKKISVAQYTEKLRQQGIAHQQIAPIAIALSEALPVEKIPGFTTGEVSVQDAGAQWAVDCLLDACNLTKDSVILDACAAPGGKTAHLLESSPAQVIAVEMDAQRAERISGTLNRLDLTTKIIVADAAYTKSWWKQANNEQKFDAILLDAPCSASGIVRRHPDILWQRREQDIGSLVKQQANLLKQLWPLLKVGGKLLYCTCSVFKAEGLDQIEHFMKKNSNAVLLSSPGHIMPRSLNMTFDDKNPINHAIKSENLKYPPLDQDGFFYALLEKNSD